MKEVDIKKDIFEKIKQRNNFKKEFIQLFKDAGLDEIEIKFFKVDIEIAEEEGFENARDYYLDWNTQFCTVTYVEDEYKEMARNGLTKILKVLEGEE